MSSGSSLIQVYMLYSCTPNNLPNEPDCLYPLESWVIWISGNSCLWSAESITFLPTELQNPGLWNPEYNSRNRDPTNDWNLESKFH